MVCSFQPPFNRTRLELKSTSKLNTAAMVTPLIVPDWNWNSFSRPLWRQLPPPLIVPDWNWNHLSHLCIYFFCAPLIVPDWNWNTVKLWLQTLISISFNRTRLELKSRCVGAGAGAWPTFNRTRLELKSVANRSKETNFPSFNRTRLELKFQEVGYGEFEIRPLIVPDWNWNTPPPLSW